MYLFLIYFLDIIQFRTHIRHEQVQHSERCHALHNDDRARYDDGVMAPLNGDGDLLTGLVDSALRLTDGGRRLYGNAEKDVASGGNASENSSCIVCKEINFFFVLRSPHLVVVLASGKVAGFKPSTEFNAFYCPYA